MTKLNQPSATRSATRAVEDDEQRTTTVEDNKQRSATVEDDKQRSATALGRAELQIDEQNFRLASFNRQALLQIEIVFFVTGKEREKDSDRKKKERERDAETERWREKK